MYKLLSQKFKALSENKLVNNSGWGIFAHITQVLFISVFFLILARHYSLADFSKYLVATVLSQLISSFSSMGLNQWFIRELLVTSDKENLTRRFFKMQLSFGFTFYIVNIGLALLLYDDTTIRILSVIFGVNILFDNIINVIKCLNISDFEQRKTFSILALESFLKFAISCLLFIFPFSIIILSIILILIRVLVINYILKVGTSIKVSFNSIYRQNVPFQDIKRLLFNNWPFIILGSVSIINWKVATIIISKALPLTDIANYEVSYKIFSIAQLLPVVVSTTVFPVLINLLKTGDTINFKSFYKKVFLYYHLFGLVSYAFIYSFADLLIPLTFGETYSDNPFFTKQMFLTILVFPTVFLQANLLVAMRMERKDMWMNVIALISNVLVCAVGLYFSKSLSVINYAVFFSFLVFHILQDVLMIRSKISTGKEIIGFYSITSAFVVSYWLLSDLMNVYWSFGLLLLAVCFYFILKYRIKINSGRSILYKS